MLPTLPEPSRWNEIYDSSRRYNIHPNTIFVFGSNLAGRHGAGAARYARECYGAVYGVPDGLQGVSYAVPTKDYNLNVLSLEQIEPYAHRFVEYTHRSNRSFFLTAVGCGLAGYAPDQIAHLFRGVQNCWIPDSFLPYIL